METVINQINSSEGSALNNELNKLIKSEFPDNLSINNKFTDLQKKVNNKYRINIASGIPREFNNNKLYNNNTRIKKLTKNQKQHIFNKLSKFNTTKSAIYFGVINNEDNSNNESATNLYVNNNEDNSNN